MTSAAPSLRKLDLDLVLVRSQDSVSGYQVELWDRGTDTLLASAATACDVRALKRDYLSRLHAVTQTALPDDFLIRLGHTLASTLLPAPLRTALFACTLRQARHDVPITLRLDIQPPSLAPIPWEFIGVDIPSLPNSAAPSDSKRGLTLESDTEFQTERDSKAEFCFLARMEGLHLVRSASGSNRAGNRQPPTTCTVEGQLRVLIVSADPRTENYPPLPHIATEIRSIQAALSSPACWNVKVETVAHVTREVFQRELLAWAPHVVYFTGHGEDFDGGILRLHTGEDGVEPVVTGRELAEWLEGTPVQMVILSACDTEGIARTLSCSGVPAVIGMQMPLSPLTAEGFARNLFSHLAQGEPVPLALWYARHTVQPPSLPDWGIPVLYLQGDGQIFRWSAARIPIHMRRLGAPHFQGRERVLLQIHHCLQHTPLLALSAMGGMGKTELALQYVRRYTDSYPGGIFWVNGHSRDEILASYAEFGRLYLNVPDDDLAEQAQWTKRRLQELEPPSLLIFDDVQSVDDLEGLLPVSPLCHLLFTTRQNVALETVASLLSVPPLEEAESHLLLRVFSDGPSNRGKTASTSTPSTRMAPTELTEAEQSAIARIADRVGHLPMALSLIASHINERKISFTRYARLMEQRKTGEDLPGLERVQSALETSHVRLSSLAKSILGAASCFGSQSISAELLRETCRKECRGFSPTHYEQALSELSAYHLISFEPPGDEEQEARVTLHECVRYFAQLKLTANRKQKLIATMGKLLSDRLDRAHDVGDWRPVQLEISHAYAIARLYRETRATVGFRAILFALANYCYEHGDYAQAAGLFSEGCVHAERASTSGDLTSTVQHQTDAARFAMKQAQMEQLLGHPELALTLIHTALDKAERLISPTDPTLADYYVCYGLILTRQGQYEQAKICYHNALSRRETAHGRQHAEIATCLNNLGTLYEKTGHLTEAISLISEALGIDESLPQPVLSNIAIRLNNLGRCKAILHDWTEALALHKRALAIHQQLFTAPQLDIAASCYYVGKTLANLHLPEEARSHLEEALAQYVKLLGSDHPNCDRVRADISAIP